MLERIAKVSRKTPPLLSIVPKQEDRDLSDVALAQNMLHEAFPRERYGKWDAALFAAYRFLKPRVERRIEREYTMRRVRSLHEGTARRVDGAEFEALKEAQIKEARREYLEIKDRLACLEASLAVADEAFFGPAMDAYRGASSPMGFRDSARDFEGE